MLLLLLVFLITSCAMGCFKRLSVSLHGFRMKTDAFYRMDST